MSRNHVIDECAAAAVGDVRFHADGWRQVCRGQPDTIWADPRFACQAAIKALKNERPPDAQALIYLASPYSHPDPDIRKERFETVCQVAAGLMRDGNHIFSPIAHCHSIALSGALPFDFAYWQKYARAMLSACSEVWVLRMDGWKESTGVQAEVKIADEMGIPVKFL